VALVRAIAEDRRADALQLLDTEPALARATLERVEEQLLARPAQIYAGDTALHAASFSYDVDLARTLIARGADVRAKNRRGAEPLHAATMGGPASGSWDPARQRTVIAYLVEAGADPNARASGGVTPLHRAVRNRCSGAVEELLRAGADRTSRNDRGSTPMDLAGSTTGRGGSGSSEAKAEQRAIIDLLRSPTS
jgi:ankyrin repeat protein